MKSVIEEIYTSNLRPTDHINAEPEYVNKSIEAEKKLTETFTEEQAELYEKYTVLDNIHNGRLNISAFRYGLQLGIRLMSEIYYNNKDK